MQPHLHRGMRDRHSRRHTEQHGVHPAGTEQPHDGHRAIRLLGVVWRPMVAGRGIVVGYSHTPCRITPCHCAHHHSTSCMAARDRRNTVPVHSVHQCGQCASPLPIAAHSTHCDATILPMPQVLKASQGYARTTLVAQQNASQCQFKASVQKNDATATRIELARPVEPRSFQPRSPHHLRTTPS